VSTILIFAAGFVTGIITTIVGRVIATSVRRTDPFHDGIWPERSIT
jgi:hypothetical protein